MTGERIMKSITAKQRRNAGRELTSTTCAGCDGPKNRGSAFCSKCYHILLENGFSILAPTFFAEKYTEELTFLLSPKGQRLRKAA